ncbi:MAG: AMP-binding protein, partial [Planctomycetales bacterium]|nr:AMP-binding protein [Planctomycetales bacterium]
RCPIVDTWWQTETGGIMMSPLPGAIPTKPGSCTKPLPGVVPSIVDEELHEVPKNHGGMLCISHPWPGMLRGIWGDEQRYQDQYWSKVPGKYLTGDNARQDDDGYYWIMGRIDDVINVSGHRLSTIVVESALVSHSKVAEAAVVGRPDEIKGQAIAAFVTIKGNAEPTEELRRELKQHVRKEIGALAQPD